MVTTLIIVIGVLVAICLWLFVALVRSFRLTSEAIKTAKDLQKIALDAQGLARSWEALAKRVDVGERAVGEAARIRGNHGRRF
jgi:hypothetical protein